MIALAGALAAVRASDHPARLRLAERARSAHVDAVAERAASLGQWTGDVDALARMTVPRPAAIETWTARREQVAHEVAALDREIQRLRSEER
ncbi:hypothetical protein AB4144_61175, partial [Rhizobiaceae sp. 2RAB30]